MHFSFIYRLQSIGSILMLVGLMISEPAQTVMFLLGSLMVLSAILFRMYLVHVLFHLPVGNGVLSYLLIPMLAFLGIGLLLDYHPEGVQPGMWFYMLSWMGAILGGSSFFYITSRRLLAMPWRNQGHK